MIRRTLHILVIAILALNLMGAWAFASAFDCGMECCQQGDWAGTTSFEARSCCGLDDVTCGFETGQYQELFETAICCFNTTSSVDDTSYELLTSDTPNAHTHTRTHAYTLLKEHPPQSTPLYLSNASFLC